MKIIKTDEYEFRIKAIPALIVDKATSSIEEPMAPYVDGIPNPDDPGYLLERVRWEQKRQRVAIDAIMAFAVRAYHLSEDGEPGEEVDYILDEEQLEMLEYFGIKERSGGKIARRLNWLEMHLPTDVLDSLSMEASLEREVRKAEETFPG